MEVGEAEGGTREEEAAEGEEAADEVGKGGGGGEGSSLARLVCVEYPGVVASPAAALATLGGLDTVAQVGYWGLGVLGYWDTGIMEYWDTSTGAPPNAPPGGGGAQPAAGAALPAGRRVLQAGLRGQTPRLLAPSQVPRRLQQNMQQ